MSLYPNLAPDLKYLGVSSLALAAGCAVRQVPADCTSVRICLVDRQRDRISPGAESLD